MSTTRYIALDRALDGARVLWRHFLTQRPPVEGWIREFNPDETLVRISATPRATDAGTWHRVYDLRIEAVLEPGRAPALREPSKLNSPTSGRSAGQDSFDEELGDQS